MTMVSTKLISYMCHYDLSKRISIHHIILSWWDHFLQLNHENSAIKILKNYKHTFNSFYSLEKSKNKIKQFGQFKQVLKL
jgi:hypothetical protein